MNLVAIFSPEHGIAGVADATVSNQADAPTGLPIYSLYGATRRPTSEMLRGIDALVFDIDNYYAFVEVSPGLFEHRKVAIASWSRAGYARIVSGLKAGDRVASGETLQVNALWHEAHGESS